MDPQGKDNTRWLLKKIYEEQKKLKKQIQTLIDKGSTSKNNSDNSNNSNSNNSNSNNSSGGGKTRKYRKVPKLGAHSAPLRSLEDVTLVTQVKPSERSEGALKLVTSRYKKKGTRRQAV